MISDTLPPGCIPPLDTTFRAAIMELQALRRAAEASGTPAHAAIVVQHEERPASSYRLALLPDGHPAAARNVRMLERCVKFLLWACGGNRVLLAAPAPLAQAVAEHYRTSPCGIFDARVMGERVFNAAFEVRHVAPDELPAVATQARTLGGHLQGCRIGFDLGASDRKVAAVIDGEVVFSSETPWNPVVQTDPDWHFEQINAMLREAAQHLPRVDAIGGSSAGIIVDNRIKVASLFRGVPEELFLSRGQNVFLRLKAAWNNIPFDVANDGDVTALAGALALRDTGVLGIAMGSSQAAGYVDVRGGITGWLNELAFAPVDMAAGAPRDEWSGDVGCGAQYFSQQAVGRLIGAAGIDAPADMALPEKLVVVQELMRAGDPRALRIYETIGVYLGMTLPWYAEFYELRHVLLLGRVLSGAGGTVIMDAARAVLQQAFPELAARLQLHTPDERAKRHGQAIAAASLPA